MGWDDHGFGVVDDEFIRREKNKARDLRRGRWWKQKISSGRCHYCGERFKPAELTMDHVVPIARGGLSVKNNLVAACTGCNSAKKASLLQEWSGDYRVDGGGGG